MFFISDHSSLSELHTGGLGFDPSVIGEHRSAEEMLSLRRSSYRIDTPFNLLFITCHPKEASAETITLQASPDQSVYFSFELPADVSLKLDLHCHDFLELLFVIEGNVYQNIEHSRHLYPAGSCCLMNRNIYHQEEYQGYQRLAFLQLSNSYLQSLLSQARYFSSEQTDPLTRFEDFLQGQGTGTLSAEKKYMDFIPLEDEAWIREHVHACFEKLLLELQSPSMGSTLRVNALVLTLMDLLFDEKHFRQTPISIGSQREKQIFDEVTAYLVRSHGRFHREELEKQLHYSGDYIYKIVHKYTGLSLFEYGMDFCMREAAELLTESDLTIEEIIRRLGFSNQTHFYKLFKEHHGESPAKYRRLHRKKPEAVLV